MQDFQSKSLQIHEENKNVQEKEMQAVMVMFSSIQLELVSESANIDTLDTHHSQRATYDMISNLHHAQRSFDQVWRMTQSLSNLANQITETLIS